MEFMGFKECINFLLGYGIIITSFISDRHVSIASHIKKVLTGITLYFDIWHLKKSKNQTELESVITYNVTYTMSAWFLTLQNGDVLYTERELF